MWSKESRLGMLLILPTLVLLSLLILFPILYNAWLSLYAKHAFLPLQTWVFLKNYAAMLADPQFWTSFKLSFVFTAASTAFQIVLGVAVALLLHEHFFGRTLARGVVLFPYMLPTIVSVVLWKWVLNDQYGIVNYLLQAWGLIEAPMVWIGPSNMMSSLVLVSIWTYFPFVVINVLARLQVIPLELYDAAKVDGASAVGRFFYVTLPQLKEVLFVVILLRGIWMFTKFDIVWLWAGDYGGLGENVRTLPIYTYMKTFGQYQVGLGAAMANIMFMLLMIVVTVYFRVFRRDEGVA
jgi:multiple sugar transport system permease protein